MDRLACIRVPGLVLQVALGRGEENRQRPLAVVREDRPASPILYLNQAGRTQGLRTGMRYSEALSVVSDLRAVTVSAEDLAGARQEILAVLGRWSPLLEPCPFDPAAFWVGVGGLEGLFGTETVWGASVRRALADRGFRALVVVGLTRGGTYVVARVRGRSTVVRSAEAEQRALAEAPLGVFPLAPRHRRRLERLGLTTLAAVLGLPADELARRFGSDLGRALRQLEVLRTVPIQSTETPEVLVRSVRTEVPVVDRLALVPLVEAPLRDGLALVQRRGRTVVELRLVLVLESGNLVSEVLRPAEPTLSFSLLVRLLGLRLGRCVLDTGVVELRLAFEEGDLPPVSGDLFAAPVVRDLTRGAEALALVRAQWGNDTVVRPVLVDSHVPEFSYRWEPTDRPRLPRPAPAGAEVTPGTPAVRRIRWTGAPAATNPSGHRVGAPCRLRVTSGARLVDRDYWFLRNGRGEVVWVSRDRETQLPAWEGVVD